MLCYSEIRKGHEIQSDGRTVWVNSERGALIARFSWAGIDYPLNESVKGPTTIESWDRFKLRMLILGVDVDDRHMPQFLRQRAA